MSVIARISAQPVRLVLSNPLATSRRAYPALDLVVVRAQSEDGAIGWGETRDCAHITGESQAGILAAIEGRLGPALTGMDPFDLAGAHGAMERVMSANRAAKSAVDMALLDLAGRLAGQPVSRLLGGGPRGPIASSKAVSVGPVETMIAEAEGFVAAGFGTLKIKTGVDATGELAAIGAIRAAVGPGVFLKLDANQGWDLPEATRFLEAAAVHDIQMVEQPLPAWDLAGHAALRRRLPIPVMLDEGVHTASDALRAIEAGAADYVNIKLIKTGGLYPARDLAALCQAAGIACQIGTLDSSIGSAAAAHLVHACPNIRFAEINGPTRAARDIATGFRVEAGQAIAPEGPGLGVVVDEAAIEELAP